MQIRRVLALFVALTITASAPSVLAQKKDETQQPKRSKAEQADIDLLFKTVDATSAGQPAPTDVPLAWEGNHFVKGQNGTTYVPFSVTVDKTKLAKDAAVYIRVVDKNAPAPAPAAAPNDKDKDKDKNQAPPPAPTFAWSSIHFIQVPADGKLSRAIALPPGDYDAYIAVTDKGTEQKNPPPPKLGVLKHELKVPDFTTTAGLVTSTIILAKTVEPIAQQLSPAQQEENPYVFGTMKIVPSEDGKFAKAGELQVIFWIYGATEATGGKPDVQVDFNFHQKLAEGEKYFNKTAPQQLNASTLPPEFSVAAGHQLPGSLVVPLASFPEGNYRLEIKVTDKPSGKTVTQNVNFTVTPS
jgi:hypothetical protein